MTTTAPPPGTATGSRTAGQDALLRTVVSVVTNATVLAALLVYFGWKRSDVQARALGLDETLFALSTQDHLLRSVDALFVPLGVAAVAGLAWLWLDGRLRRRLADPASWKLLEPGLGIARWSWLLLPLLAALAGFAAPAVGLVVFPLSFGVGALLTAHAVHLGHDLERHRGVPGPERTWRTDVTRGLVAVVVLLSLFWTITNVADSRGRALADALERDVPRLPAVVVHSDRPLGIDAPGVTEERLGEDAYSYRGLRLLHHHDATFLLVHDGWTRDRGVVLVLKERSDLRFEFVTGAPSPDA